jgi:putative tryptophan/tyrosine transport system substrate-binding protein
VLRKHRATLMNKFIWFVLCAMLFALCNFAEAQQQAKIPKIGVLRGQAISTPVPSFELLLRAFRELGYIEGKNITFETRSTEGKLDRYSALADELVRLKVDVLVVSSTSAALAAKNAAKTTPIVFLNVSDPVASGLIDSLPRPGGNITGVASIDSVLAGKRLELLKETIPDLSRVAILWNPQDRGSTQQWNESQLAARELGLQLHSSEVSSADKFEGAFTEAVRTFSTALAVTQHPLAASNRNRIVDLAIKNRLPTIYSRGDYLTSGGLMSYGRDESEPYRRVASMVNKILRGTKPADIPVEQPTKFEFIINLKAAKQIGLTIPPNVLARADKVIK